MCPGATAPMSDTKIRLALIRLLWNSVSDQATCTCSPGDGCPECEAMAALGLGRWTDAYHAGRALTDLETELRFRAEAN